MTTVVRYRRRAPAPAVTVSVVVFGVRRLRVERHRHARRRAGHAEVDVARVATGPVGRYGAVPDCPCCTVTLVGSTDSANVPGRASSMVNVSAAVAAVTPVPAAFTVRL
jgi:hypothetical protein